LTDQKSVFTDQIRFKLGQADKKVDIELYIPELKSIEEDIRETLYYGLKRFIVKLIGESMFGRRISDINFYPLPSDLSGAYTLSELNSELSDG